VKTSTKGKLELGFGANDFLSDLAFLQDNKGGTATHSSLLHGINEFFYIY